MPDLPDISERDAKRLIRLVDLIAPLVALGDVETYDGYTAEELAEAKAMLKRMNNEPCRPKARRKGRH